MFSRGRAIWFAVAALVLANSAEGQVLPTDLDAALRKNLDKYVFKDISIKSHKRDEYGLWVCGRINIQIWPGGVTSTFVETDFVGQVFPENSLGTRSVITAAGPLFPAGQETHDKYCK